MKNVLRIGGLAAGLALGGITAAPSHALSISGGKLPTRWSAKVAPGNVLSGYPRPQMARKTWMNLNGVWEYGLTDKEAAAPSTFTGEILVPFPWEAALSGVGKPSIPGQRLWYHRTFTVPSSWGGQRVLLHFGAVNWDSTVLVNGKQVAAHRGGYDGFDADVTDSLKPGANDLTVSAWNPIDDGGGQVIGKQRLRPGGIFYTGATGIWQTVWLEPVPTAHIAGIKITPDLQTKTVHIVADVDGAADAAVSVTVLIGKKSIATSHGTAGADIVLPISDVRTWSPKDPFLYGLRVTVDGQGRSGDTVDSYFAMRKISLGKDATGVTRLMLNDQPVLQVGTLDQGYWPDGIYTAPTDDALKYDIEITKRLGYNMIRKHAKVEPARWYYWTDKLGMLVWQDMPQGYNTHPSDEVKSQFDTELKALIAQHYNAPSIVVWTTFNEGWGQHDTEREVALVKQLDPTRLVNNASGWNDMKVGDIADTHAYPGPWSGKPEETRAAVNGEFGGVTMRVKGHMWTTDLMGYGAVLKNGWQVTKRYQELLKTAYGLVDTQGTSAFVYTQITDVEQESNGILTYDRKVIKPDLKIVAAANQGEFLPLPPDPTPPTPPQVIPTSETTPQTWRYTTDKPADDWTQTAFDDAAWKEGKGPFGHDVGSPNTQWTTSDIWLRRTATVQAPIPAKLVIVAVHDEDVEVYINGVLAGSATGFTGGYVEIPLTEAGRAALKPGANVIAVHCHQTIGGQSVDVGIARPD